MPKNFFLFWKQQTLSYHSYFYFLTTSNNFSIVVIYLCVKHRQNITPYIDQSEQKKKKKIKQKIFAGYPRVNGPIPLEISCIPDRLNRKQRPKKPDLLGKELFFFNSSETARFAAVKCILGPPPSADRKLEIFTLSSNFSDITTYVDLSLSAFSVARPSDALRNNKSLSLHFLLVFENEIADKKDDDFDFFAPTPARELLSSSWSVVSEEILKGERDRVCLRAKLEEMYEILPVLPLLLLLCESTRS